MPPKKSQKARIPLEPLGSVTKDELKKAQNVLKDAERRKRIQANMRFALQQKGQWEAYWATPQGARQQYLEGWTANNLTNEKYINHGICQGVPSEYEY